MELMDILEYITYTPNNTNPAILKQMLTEYGAEDTFDEVWEYIGKNVDSLNLSVLAPIIMDAAAPTPSEDGDKVGTITEDEEPANEEPVNEEPVNEEPVDEEPEDPSTPSID